MTRTEDGERLLDLLQRASEPLLIMQDQLSRALAHETDRIMMELYTKDVAVIE